MAIRKPVVAHMKVHCENVSTLLRALSHPQRLMIMGHLLDGPKSVTELQGLCGITQSQLSQFLSRMKLEGLVKRVRKGRFCYYEPAGPKVVKLIQAITSIYCS